jgi:uncharacterized membrane protein
MKKTELGQNLIVGITTNLKDQFHENNIHGEIELAPTFWNYVKVIMANIFQPTIIGSGFAGSFYSASVISIFIQIIL